MAYEKITVGQLCHLYIEPTDRVRLWGIEQVRTLFEGTFREAEFSAFAGETVGSFCVEKDGVICVNIDY